jgi:hypothetical protein
VAFVKNETCNESFAALFSNALSVELENANTPKVRQWEHLFPDGEKSVAQGSSLSALCANLTLTDFDQALRSFETTAIRYIDDFVVLGRSRAAVEKATLRAQKGLHHLGLEMWFPEEDAAKASSGLVRTGFDFLSYHIDGQQVGIAQAARKRLLERVRLDLSEAMTAIKARPDMPRTVSSPGYTNVLSSLDRRLWGWANSFNAVTRGDQFEQIDKEVALLVDRFLSQMLRFEKGHGLAERRRIRGVTLTSDAYAIRRSGRQT